SLRRALRRRKMRLPSGPRRIRKYSPHRRAMRPASRRCALLLHDCWRSDRADLVWLDDLVELEARTVDDLLQILGIRIGVVLGEKDVDVIVMLRPTAAEVRNVTIRRAQEIGH